MEQMSFDVNVNWNYSVPFEMIIEIREKQID